MPVLLLKTAHGNLAYPLTEGKPLFIGRAKECDIHLASSAVSRRHAVVLFKNGACGVKDLGSFNGTQINGETLSSPRHLLPGDVLAISSFVFTLLEEAPAETGQPAREPPAAVAAPSDTESRRAGAMTPEEALEQLVLDIQSDLDAKGGGGARGGGDGVDDTQMYVPGDSGSAPFAPNAGEERREDTPSVAPVGGGLDEPPVSELPADEPAPTSVDAGLLDSDDTSYFQEPPAAEEAPDGLDGDVSPEAGANESDIGADAIFPLGESEDEVRLSVSTGFDDPAVDQPAAGPSEPAPDTAVYALLPEIGEEPDLGGGTGAVGDGATESITGRRAGTFVAGKGAGFFDNMADGSGTARIHVGAGGDDAEPVTVEMTPALVAAIDARLSLHVLLQDLADERGLLRNSAAVTPEAEAELARQESELDNMPTANEVERLIGKLRGRWEAEDGGGARDAALRAAEEMAVAQWTLLRDSSREALPAVFKEAYRLAADEPLARELAAAGINHGRLMGGAVYLIALEAMARAAGNERNRVSSHLRAVTGDAGDEGGGGMLGRLGRLASGLKNRQEKREEAERLAERVRASAMRAELAAREMKFVERLMIREFRQVYVRAALHFVPQYERMPLAVRAFLRHGAIGFKPWWMTPAVRDFVMRDCRDNVVAGFENVSGDISVFYADEYLAAVSRMECSPSPDESLARRGRGSEERRADRGYRRIVNSRTYNVLMQDLLSELGYRRRDFEREASDLDDRIAAITSRPHNRDEVAELESRHQMMVTRCENLARQVKRIENEIVASILAAVEEAEGRFRRGELAMPDQASLIRREADALADIARRMAGSRECFMPGIIRRYATPDGGIVNDRATVHSQLAELESLDPGIFKSIIVPAKRRYNRIELHLGPTVILVPAAGYACVCVQGRDGMEGGHLAVPTCFARPDLRERQMCNLLADFRWETSRHLGGLDLMNSDTLTGIFMRIRWEWRNLPKAKREKGLILAEISDLANWRRVYEVYMQDAMNGVRQLYLRNPELYSALIGRFIDLPDGVEMVKRQ